MLDKLKDLRAALSDLATASMMDKVAIAERALPMAGDLLADLVAHATSKDAQIDVLLNSIAAHENELKAQTAMLNQMSLQIAASSAAAAALTADTAPAASPAAAVGARANDNGDDDKPPKPHRSGTKAYEEGKEAREQIGAAQCPYVGSRMPHASADERETAYLRDCWYAGHYNGPKPKRPASFAA